MATGNDPVIDPNATENNKAPANIGQAKYITRSALDALLPILPDVTANIETDLAPIIDLTIPAPKPAGWEEKQKAPLLVGQLKAIADPFYTHLKTAAPAWLEAERTANGTNHTGSIFPWTIVTTDDNDKGIANIGQLKSVFSLRFNTDSDTNSLPDLWEHVYFESTGVDPNADDDGDGLGNFQELMKGTNPNKADTDDDGTPDAEDLAPRGKSPQLGLHPQPRCTLLRSVAEPANSCKSMTREPSCLTEVPGKTERFPPLARTSTPTILTTLTRS